MRLGFYSEIKDISRIQSTMKVVLNCFEQIKQEVYGISGMKNMTSISMFERFIWLEKNVPELEKVYNIKIHLDCSKCCAHDRVFVPVDAPSAVFSNAIQNASKADATDIHGSLRFYPSLCVYIVH